MAPTPVTILTGFLGSGKTTILLNLIPQLPKNYKLALLKNEFGDLAVDSQLASQQSVAGVRELLNGCICCNLVGQLSDALVELRGTQGVDRIVIETSGSAFPATLAMEVNRLAREMDGCFVLDGVVSVIDVENWQGYEDTSYTAKLQAKYTDLIVLNKWEGVSERKFDEALDRVGDLEVMTAWVKSDKGWVDKQVLLGVDGAIASKGQKLIEDAVVADSHAHGHGHGDDEEHKHDHQSEVEVLSVTLTAVESTATIDTEALETLLLAAPKDEVYRIKAIFRVDASKPPSDSNGAQVPPSEDHEGSTCGYVLNWAFGRWTFTPVTELAGTTGDEPALRMTLVLARGEATRWTKKIESGEFVALEGSEKGSLEVKKITH